MLLKRMFWLSVGVGVLYFMTLTIHRIDAASNGAPDPEAIRLAIEDIELTFGDEYPNAEQYLNELAKIEELDASPQKDERLLELQKRALLATPLLLGKRIIAVRI